MYFTMKYAYHATYKTTFTKTVEAHGGMHALIAKALEKWLHRK